MKLHYLFLLFVILCCSCKKETLAPFVSENFLEEFQTEKAQVFDLDTIAFKDITGKHGTKIFFDRALFDVKDNEKIQLELIELYDFKEILYHNIQTLTTDNKLLESSGVLKVTFTANGKEIKLKKGELVIVYPPNGKLKNNDIFLSKKDSLNNITWDITDQNYSLFSVHLVGGIWEQILINNDSISYYKKLNKKNTGYESYDDLITENLIVKDFLVIGKNNSNWINIDRFVDIDARIDFNLKNQKEDFSGFDIYFNYMGLNSFMHEPRISDHLNFYDIPISGKMYITVLGKKENELFYDKIELNNSIHNTTISLNMKKTTKEALKKLFDGL